MGFTDRVKSAITSFTGQPKQAIVQDAVERKRREDAVIYNTGSAWQNEQTGYGTTGYDPATHTLPGPPMYLGPDVLADLYVSDPIAETIVGAIVDDALRCGFKPKYTGEVESDKERVSDVDAVLERVSAAEKLRKGAKWGRCMGIGGTLLVVNGGSMSAKVPLVDDSVQSLDELVVFDARDVQVRTWRLDEHWTYVWQPQITSTEQATTLEIGRPIDCLHRSHLIRFGGLDTPQRDQIDHFDGFDQSALQLVWETISRFRGSWMSIDAMLLNASQTIVKIPQLWRVMITNRARWLARIADIAMQRSASRILTLDAGDQRMPSEEYEEVARAFSGISDLTIEKKSLIAQAAKMPITRLFGISPAGLNATGEFDWLNWLAMVGSYRSGVLDPRFTRVVQLAARDAGVSDPMGWGVEWPSLEVLSQTMKADLEQQHVQTDLDRVELGVPRSTVLAGRYAQGFYSNDPPLMTMEEIEKIKAMEELEEIEEEPEPVEVEEPEQAVEDPAEPDLEPGTEPEEDEEE